MTPSAAPVRHLRPRQQRGVATLIVVMVLFFVVTLVAAYTNRNLIFEQRTSANQYRATMSFETAQAGLQWAVAMLNGSRIDANCAPSVSSADTTFRERYLNTDATTGLVSGNLKSDGTTLYAACVFNGSGWNCSCPADADPAPTVPTGAGLFPAFQVRFIRNTTSSPAIPPGVIRVDAVACPRFDATCLSTVNAAGDEGRSVVSALIGLQSALKTPPAAALTVRGGLNVGTASIRAFNSDITSGAVAVQLGGTSDSNSRLAMVLGSAPGTPSVFGYVEGDSMLFNLTTAGTLLPTLGDRMFATLLGMAPATYRGQPALTVVDGCPCTAQQVRDAIAQNPLRPIWVDGDLAIDSSGNIGSTTAPVMLVVAGNMTFTNNVTIYGVVYSRGDPWTTGGTGTIQGAAVAENDLAGNGTATYVYNRDVLNLLRIRYGSFVVIPGSWKDYTPI
jgi:Tfp pilus assembly protein PilX